MWKRLIITLTILQFSFSAVCFSPNGGAREALLRLMQTTTQSIDVAIYSFTSKELALGLIAASQGGRTVRVIMDRSQLSGKNSVAPWLAKYLELRILPNAQARGIMHHKFMLIGDKYLTTGSYNWTNNAEFFNYENMFILKDKETIAAFKTEFGKMWGKASPYIAR